MRNKTKRIVLSALLASLTCVATMTKFMILANGYLNFGDSVVLLSGWILSPVYGFLTAGIGSALADIFSGYAIYVPATFVIKGLMALSSCLVFKSINKKAGNLSGRIISGVIAEIIMVSGYYLFEGLVYGFGASAVNIPANAVQGIAGLIIGLILINVFQKTDMR